MAWFVYVLRCGDGSLYTGISTDVEARVAVHRQGRGARYTRGRGPLTVVHVERKRSRATALQREARIKALPRPKKEALLTTAAPGTGKKRPPGKGRVVTARASV